MDLPRHPYSIKVYKEYFNFSASHFLIFADGSREPLHGHNYRVRAQLEASILEADMVFDFLNIKPLIRKACDELDHRLLIPQNNPHLTIFSEKNNYRLSTPDGSEFSIPQKDILFLPISNTSAERLAIYLCSEVSRLLFEKYSFQYKQLVIEVEETPGQSATYILKGENGDELHRA